MRLDVNFWQPVAALLAVVLITSCSDDVADTSGTTAPSWRNWLCLHHGRQRSGRRRIHRRAGRCPSPHASCRRPSRGCCRHPAPVDPVIAFTAHDRVLARAAQHPVVTDVILQPQPIVAAASIEEIEPAARSPTYKSITRAVRGASGIVTSLRPLRTIRIVR
jgi:hypothetical protein